VKKSADAQRTAQELREAFSAAHNMKNLNDNDYHCDKIIINIMQHAIIGNIGNNK
jgi:hypothetical protein